MRLGETAPSWSFWPGSESLTLGSWLVGEELVLLV
jgi:hypothetical protein